jgi:DNA replication regulator SLD3
VKKARLEAELRDAISALKRPNRQLAGQLQVETAEKRASSASLHTKSKLNSFRPCSLVLISTESKKPIRNPSFQDVQILSTPKGSRQKEGTKGGHHKHRLDLGRDHEVEVVPPSSLPRIPLSVARAANTRESGQTPLFKATPARSRPGSKAISAICETPSQGQATSPSRLSNRLFEKSSQNHVGLPPCSPLQAKRSSKTEFLDMPVPLARAVECTPSKLITVQATPCKQGKTNTFLADAPLNCLNIVMEVPGIEEIENAGRTGIPQARGSDDISIYKSLGWDDYDDIA